MTDLRLIDEVFNLSNHIMKTTKHVRLNSGRMTDCVEAMLKEPREEKQVDDKKINMSDNTTSNIILEELVADSVNYCYWQFNSGYRPIDAGSTKMRNLLDSNFESDRALMSNINLAAELRNFYSAMVRNRFPLMDKRLTHLNALTRCSLYQSASNMHSYESAKCVAMDMVDIVQGGYPMQTAFKNLVSRVDGFGEDPFLKRAILFFLQLNRILGLYEEEIKILPIPADYQVPKIMNGLGLFTYTPPLNEKIINGEHLQENGPEEMSIRAAAIQVASILGEETGWSPSEVDGWFFARRKNTNSPFHCCITSNY